MDVIGVIIGYGIFLSITNILFCFLYLLSFSAGKGFYRWITMDADFLELITIPFLGLTNYTANKLYNSFNWFTARVFLIVYVIILMILIIPLGILFDAVASS